MPFSVFLTQGGSFPKKRELDTRFLKHSIFAFSKTKLLGEQTESMLPSVTETDIFNSPIFQMASIHFSDTQYLRWLFKFELLAIYLDTYVS